MSIREIDQLIAAGKLIEAASRCEEEGDYARAVDLHEKLWNFTAAADAARKAGDDLRALLNLLSAQNRPAIFEFLDEIIEKKGPAMIKCAEVCESRGMNAHAARLYLAAGFHLAAAECFERAGLFLEAAGCFENADQYHRALDLYRQTLANITMQTPLSKPTEIEAACGLGRLLMKFGRPAEALPFFQRAQKILRHIASNTSTTSIELMCLQGTVSALLQLGYLYGAKAALKRLRLHPHKRSITLQECIDNPQFAPISTSAPEERLLVGRYRVDKLLGAGGMGRVYQAVDQLTQKIVAIKIFTAPFGPCGRDAFSRFGKEARVTGSLQHPHLVSLFDFNEPYGFMVLEYLDGGTLSDRLRPALDVGSCRSIMLQILSGLTVAHQHGIIHRDIKPSNIFFTQFGAVKLGDFGVAHLQNSEQTQTGGFIGTLAYISPEQIKGEAVSFATDIYAVGVTLFQMLTGRLPFSPPDLVTKHILLPAPKPSSLAPHLPPICDRVIERCLAKAPHERFSSLAELEQMIMQFPTEHTSHKAQPLLSETSSNLKRRATDRRFAVETPLVSNKRIQILKAQDLSLGREVLIVRITPGGHREEIFARLTAAAAWGNECLQRVFALDAEKGQAILEAEEGSQLNLDEKDLQTKLHLAACLGRALLPLHRAGFAHGGIELSAITYLGNAFTLSLVPTLLDPSKASVENDVRDVIKLLGWDLHRAFDETRLTLHSDELEQLVRLKDGEALACWAIEKLRGRE